MLNLLPDEKIGRFAEGAAPWIVAVLVGVGVLTVYSMTKIWAEVFWKASPGERPPMPPLRGGERALLLGPIAGLAAPSVAFGQAQARTLRFIPQSNLSNIDPVWSTAVIVRNHGLMIYDTLYGLGGDFQPKPQMAQGHEITNNGLTWTITLRPGLRFHDGEPVRAKDCIASIARWSKRDVLGQRRLPAVQGRARAME